MGPDPVSAQVLARLSEAVPRGEAICAGFSGGLDSTVLLDILHRHAHERGWPLAAVHVHHGLSPNADAWATACADFCAVRGITLAVDRVHVRRDAPEGLEAAARAARYAVFASRPERWIVLAHHRDDQAETVLLQLLRGTGLKGVAAMPPVRRLPGTAQSLVRPLLELPRAALEAHARAAGLRWVEDESNAAFGHDRNYLRHEIAPRLDARFGDWRASLARFARHAAAADELLQEVAHRDGVPVAPGEPLPVDASLPAARRANALRAFLAVNGVAMPGEARLQEMARQLFGARADARVRLEHGALALLRHRDRVHLEPRGDRPGVWRVDWHREDEVDLGPGRGRVRFERASGAGIAMTATREGEWFFAPRTGGERIRLDRARPTRTLKNLLQEHAVPPWRRKQLPLLFHGERLVWVPGVGVAADYACAPGKPGLRPCWRLAGKAPLC